MHFWDLHKTITHYYETLTKSVCDQYGLTHMEYDILMFLYNNPDYKTAADIVKIRKSTKSHVSTSLKSLKDKGIIEKKQREDNKKYIKIVLTDSAEEIAQAGLDVQRQFIKNIFQGLTEEEITTCKSVFRRVCDNAEKCLMG